MLSQQQAVTIQCCRGVTIGLRHSGLVHSCGPRRSAGYGTADGNDALQAYRRVASREEKELQDVERCMEEELVAEHMQVERVIHLRGEEVKGQHQLKYLVKVSGCPTL